MKQRDPSPDRAKGSPVPGPIMEQHHPSREVVTHRHVDLLPTTRLPVSATLSWRTEKDKKKRKTKRCWEREGEGEREGKRERERERETQNSELYYSRIEILGNSLFLRSVLVKLHR